VSAPEVWSRFEEEDDASFDLAKLADKELTSFVIDEASWTESELKGIVRALAETLGKDGIIIADTHDINVNPYNYCVLYLGNGVYSEEFSIYRGRGKHEMHRKTNISDIAEWLSYGEFGVSDAEKDQLFRCGIALDGKKFYSFSKDLTFPKKIYLRETSFEKRSGAIENCVVGEEVYFVRAGNDYDSMRLEVFGELGSLGYLPSEVGDKVCVFLSNNKLKYTATIVDIVKLSQRNKHAKSPIVAISIDAEFSEEAGEPKTSVPSIDREKRYS
jgi:hypothetical protein